MSSLHAIFSLAAGLGALGGFAAIHWQASPLVHFSWVALVFAVIMVAVSRVRFDSARSPDPNMPAFAWPPKSLIWSVC